MTVLGRILYGLLGFLAGGVVSFVIANKVYSIREDQIVLSTAFIHCSYINLQYNKDQGLDGIILETCSKYAETFSNNFKDVKSQGE